MAKKQFKIRAKLAFSGYAVVYATTRQEAETIVERGLRGMLGKVETSSSEEERIKDWEFGTHAETTVSRKEAGNNG